MSDRHLMYLIGEPGIGKTTLMRALTKDHPYEEAAQPFAHKVYDNGVWELGRDREDFGGTDALAMDVQPDVLQFMESIHPRYVMAEGDRLANKGFFTEMRRLGYTLHVYHLTGEGLATQRRLARGSKQNETWIKGRRTKSKALAEWLDAEEIYPTLDATVYVGLLNDPVSERFR